MRSLESAYEGRGQRAADCWPPLDVMRQLAAGSNGEAFPAGSQGIQGRAWLKAVRAFVWQKTTKRNTLQEHDKLILLNQKKTSFYAEHFQVLGIS